MKKRTIYNKAFTLIELMVVMAIISLLSALVLNSLASARMKANDTKIAQDLRQFRIAAELYYNDNHEYPTTAMNDQNRSFAINQSSTDWAHKLSFFIKTAEAAGHTKTLLCVNFDNAAEKMVDKKYLSSIPVHPYDNDEAGVCYKAINATTTFASYAVLTTQINSSSPLAQKGVINKSVGFIMGDTSPTGLQGLIDGTPFGEPLYPSGVDGKLTTDLTSSVNAIADVTDGASTLTNGLGGVIYYITNTFTPPGLPPVVIVPPPVITMHETMSCINDVCTCNYGYVFLQDGNENTVSGTCNLAPVMYTLTVVKGSVSMGYSIVLTYNMMGGTPFYSPQSFESGTFVSVYAAITNGSSYKQPMFSGCDTVSGLTNCNVTMYGNRTITVSD